MFKYFRSKNHYLLLIVLLFAVLSCQKEDPKPAEEEPVLSEEWEISSFHNPTGNITDEAVQVKIINTLQNYTIKIFGTFDTSNNPEKVASVTFQKALNDTVVNFLYNDLSQLETVYLSVAGVKQPYVIKHTYPPGTTDAASMLVYNYDWTTQTGELIYDALYENIGGEVKGTLNFFKSDLLDYIGGIVTGTVLVESGIYAFGGTGGLMGTAAGPFIAAAAGTLLTVAAVATIVVGALVLISNNASAANIEPGDPVSPLNQPLVNPVSDPNPYLPPPTCVGSNINANVTMDQFGSVMFSNPQGGSSFKYSFDNSPFQTGPVFNGPYTPGSYMIMIQNEQGCIRSEIRYIEEYQFDCSTLQINLNQSGANITATASGGQTPYTFKFAGSSFSSSQSYPVTFDGKYEVIVKDANNCTDTAYISICDVQLTNVAIVPNGLSGYYIEISYSSPLGLNPEFIIGPDNIPLLIIESSNYSSMAVNINDYCDGGGMSYPYLNPGFISSTGDQYNKTIRYSIPGSSTTGTVSRSISFRLPGNCFSSYNCSGNVEQKASQLYNFQWLEN